MTSSNKLRYHFYSNDTTGEAQYYISYLHHCREGSRGWEFETAQLQICEAPMRMEVQKNSLDIDFVHEIQAQN